ncbi:MAG: DUF262 domain-containing protein [Nostoc sp.]|uniref:DUF262 domain-containing protein n=1 Tax=Nostoc sp. TaxID=1180 RepID=UPI002FEFB64E
MPKTIYYIESLPLIFRRIDSGEIHIPQFQRRFVWGREEIIQLFDSIYNGLPIGTLLFWRSSEKNFMFSQDDFMTSSQTEEQASYMYVIDGTQRLRALYNCLHRKENGQDSRFAVGFDLEKKIFTYLHKVNVSETIVVLSSVFSHEEIIKHQITLASHHASQILVKNFNELISAFVKYEIPIIVIDEVTKDEMLTAFQRINTTGTRLSKEDILRAREEYIGKDEL